MKNGFNHIDDFILDDKFQKWVLRPDDFDNHYWQSFIKANPDKIALIEEAKKILLSIDIHNEPVNKEHIDLQYRKLLAKTGLNQSKSSLVSKTLFKVAAAVAVLIVSSLLAYFNFFQSSYDFQYNTEYGEVKQLVLPDSTLVTLNGNSTIAYNNDWRKQGTRQVWLNGEAFFHVKHHPVAYPDFHVVAGDLKIEVTGTKFNLHYRENKKSVVLNEGSLNLSSTKNNSHVNLVPGEMAIYNPLKSAFTKVNVKPEVHKSWVDSRLVFDNTPLIDVINILRDTYGMEVEFDSAIQQRRISGTVPSDNLDVLLLAIEKTFNFKIHKENNHIKIY